MLNQILKFPRLAIYIHISILIGYLIFLNSCASISGFQTARTIGKDSISYHASLNVMETYDFELLRFDQMRDIDSFHIAPVIDVGARYGVGRKFDIGLNLSSYSHTSLDLKYQLTKKSSKTKAVALGFKAGGYIYKEGDRIYDYQLHLYLSHHTEDKVHLYLTPKFIRQFSGKDRYNYLGFNTGILFGKRNKWGIELSYFNLVKNKNELQPIFSFGVGGSYTFPLR